MSLLNPSLYEILRLRFGDVKVSNEGEALIGAYKFDPVYDRVVLDIDSWGETYCVSCIFCYEDRQRLCFNHRYGVHDEITKSNNHKLVRCFNEECMKKDETLYKQLWDKLFGFMNAHDRKSITYTKGRTSYASASDLKECAPPGEVHMFCDMDVKHPALSYLTDRGYDLEKLITRHNLMYCHLADPKYPLAQNRIIVPIVQDKKCVGWQARYVGDIDWKAAGVPKYYTLPSMPKRLVLYNHDVAFNQKFVVVTEGPTSCWNVYPYGVALLGKQATIQQQRLLIKNSQSKPIVILLDSDAKYEAEKLYRSLKDVQPVVKIDLPEGRDPGSYLNKESELWDTIIEQSDKQGLNLRRYIDGS